ncbi:MAG: AMP-binding protein [Actinomycetales bacterium]|nr:AMP-binding protein [Actinomycetales bacterium]
MSEPSARAPRVLDLPTGPAAVAVLRAALESQTHAAPLAPIPTLSPRVSEDYRARLVAAVAPDQPADPACDVILTTSGSTAHPKGVMHSRAAIEHSARALHERLGGPGHWLCALPLHTSAGFMTVARAVVAGAEATGVASLGAALAFTPAVFASGVAELPPGRAYTSLVPEMAHRLVGDAAGLAALQRFDAVLLGGQAIPATLLAALDAAGVRAVTSYGMTETCGGCVYDGIPLPGVTLSIEAGTVRVTGPVVMLGYRGQSAPSTDAADRTFLTNDLGAIAADGRLTVHGRTDDIEIVNGVNVSMTAVEALLRGLGINAVACSVGDRVIAATASAIGPDEAEAAAARAKQALSVRIDFRVVPQTPTTPAGKPDRAALAAALRDAR